MAAVMGAEELIGLLAKSSCRLVWLDDSAGLVLGNEISSPAEYVNFATETLDRVMSPRSKNASLPRRSGSYRAVVLKEGHEFNRLTDIMKWVLPRIEKEKPGTLSQLEKISPRSKRIIARDRYELFKGKTREFTEKHSEQLDDRFWIGTNNSKDEVRRWIERTAEIAGFTYGQHVRLELN